MESVSRKDHNTLYRGPTAEIGDLPCRREEPGLIVSHWRPNEEELARLNAGGVIELNVWAEPIPPLLVTAASDDDTLAPRRDSECPHCGFHHSHELAFVSNNGRELRLCRRCRKAYDLEPEGEPD